VLALLGLGMALAVAGWTGRARLGAQPTAEHARIARRHGHLIVEAIAPAVAGARVVELEDFESLRRMAERADRLILHATSELGDEYTVDDGGSLYRYRAGVPVEPEAWLHAVAGRS
jgi:hypothetical protein